MWGPSLADAKISELPDGGTIQPSDQVPVNRAGTTVRATGAATASGQTIRASTTQISPAELLALSATPVQLVAAPGPGEVIVPVSIIASLGPATAPYTSDGGFTGLAAASLGSTWLDINSWLANDPGDSRALRVASNDADISRLVWLDFGINYVDQPLMLMSSSNLASGDGPLSLTVFYVVIDGVS
jgi:hypothetical protein